MRLSDAIRLGATLRPQAFNAYYVGNASCAMGAACDAVGADPTDSDGLPFGWDDLLRGMYVMACPVCAERVHECMVPHLNDKHRWTRERIADFVATLEPPEPEPEVLPPAHQQEVACG